MQLLTTKRVYDVEGDQSNLDFLKLVESPPPGVIILDGNAGLGADWPAGIWKSLNAAAIALAVFSAPSSIEENWPRWKAIYDEITHAMMEFHGEFRIDRDTAQMIAMQNAVAVHGLSPRRLDVHMAIRHYFSSFAGYEDLLTTDRVEMDWPDQADFGTKEFSKGVRSNEEAARQARCRYLFGISDGSQCLTICVEQDGSVSLEKSLDMNADWG